MADAVRLAAPTVGRYTSAMHWLCRDRVLPLDDRPLVMGIVNVTPDSFSDGGRHPTPDAAIAHALRLVADGADLLDVGGESTRPGSLPVALDGELARVVPVVAELVRRTGLPISVDTSKAEVARQCLEAGACVVNDVTGLAGDPLMIDVVRQFGAGVVVMHMRGTPATMQIAPHYDDVVRDVTAYLAERSRVLTDAGIDAGRIALDPGIGFGKTFAHNVALLRGLSAVAVLGRPVVLGVSRKGFLGTITGRPAGERDAASLAAAVWCAAQGAADVRRVHEVAISADAVRVVGALQQKE